MKERLPPRGGIEVEHLILDTGRVTQLVDSISFDERNFVRFSSFAVPGGRSDTPPRGANQSMMYGEMARRGLGIVTDSECVTTDLNGKPNHYRLTFFVYQRIGIARCRAFQMALYNSLPEAFYGRTDDIEAIGPRDYQAADPRDIRKVVDALLMQEEFSDLATHAEAHRSHPPGI